VVRCFLMSGSDDYLLIVLVRDIEDFERIHRTELSRLPHVSRIQSNFALREVVNRTAPLGIFEKPARHVQSQLPQRHSPNMGRDADPTPCTMSRLIRRSVAPGTTYSTGIPRNDILPVVGQTGPSWPRFQGWWRSMQRMSEEPLELDALLRNLAYSLERSDADVTWLRSWRRSFHGRTRTND